jgi:hypothetical protein
LQAPHGFLVDIKELLDFMEPEGFYCHNNL